jgi:hypothetical protein
MISNGNKENTGNKGIKGSGDGEGRGNSGAGQKRNPQGLRAQAPSHLHV